MPPIDPDLIIAEFNKKHHYLSGNCLFVSRLLDEGLSQYEVAVVIHNLNWICKECFDADRDCQCWNDE